VSLNSGRTVFFQSHSVKLPMSENEALRPKDVISLSKAEIQEYHVEHCNTFTDLVKATEIYTDVLNQLHNSLEAKNVDLI
jgi:hypothetical protein